MYSVSDSSHKLGYIHYVGYIYCSDSFYNKGSAIAKKNQTAHLLNRKDVFNLVHIITICVVAWQMGP